MASALSALSALSASSAASLFVGGTASNAGKSWMVTAICAWLRARGVSAAPFKAQNMSNHSYPCHGGGEIGRAQVAQAEACGLSPEPAMNPILLKPNGNGTSQVVVNGRVWKTLSARDYYAEVPRLRAEVLAAHADLARRFDVIVIEGAGSVSEVNLRDVDLVNLDIVRRLDVPWVLVADIERGGVIASVTGAVSLLEPAERALLRGVLVNRFRGDMTLFDGGVRAIESHAGVPCLGVFPVADDMHVDAEDSLAVARAPRVAPPPGARTAIVALPRLSNATDFRLLTWAEWIAAPSPGAFDVVILPGTKDTLGDLAWLESRGLDTWIREQHDAGATIIGVCGGFQMLGATITDPDGVESLAGTAAGLGLLPVETVLTREKTTAVVNARLPSGTAFSAYEIHMGLTRSHSWDHSWGQTPDHAGGLTPDRAGGPMAEARPFAWRDDGSAEGIRVGRVMGTYLHGAFEDAGVVQELLGVGGLTSLDRAREYERLGMWFERHAVAPERWVPGA